WERFLRSASINAYAAQEILRRCPLLEFVKCGDAERKSRFAELVGSKVLDSFSQVIHTPFVSA
ncbi:uncharacterized protein V2V93DRAFT_347903, partial [Kockiozyma suomiensis]|uniref:uncharacterized protein n=1 Tax=Kockiozyma suomiensis TaxID=1337062 RepID=UPI003344251A